MAQPTLHRPLVSLVRQSRRAVCQCQLRAFSQTPRACKLAQTAKGMEAKQKAQRSHKNAMTEQMLTMNDLGMAPGML